MYQGYIFDLDGVIVHTDKYHYLAWKQLADGEHIPFDEQVNHRLRGVSRMESLEIILERAERNYTAAEKERMAEKKNEAYRRFLLCMTPQDVSPQVRDTLMKLKAGGARLAVGSSSKNAKLILRQTGMEEYFDAVADGNDIKKSKPDPEVFLLAAQRICLPPSACLVIEDACAGIDAALAGGFDAAAIGAACEHTGKTYALQTFSDLLAL